MSESEYLIILDHQFTISFFGVDKKSKYQFNQLLVTRTTLQYQLKRYFLKFHGLFNQSYLKTVEREPNYKQRQTREALEMKKAKFDKDIQL